MPHKDPEVARLDALLIPFEETFIEIAEQHALEYSGSEEGDFAPPFRRLTQECENPMGGKTLEVGFARGKEFELLDPPRLQISAFATFRIEKRWWTLRRVIQSFESIPQLADLRVVIEAALRELQSWTPEMVSDQGKRE
ncbi:MAG: hypothetical protein AAF236_10030 [Verrucomicrobiota bacterium]